MTSNPPVSKVGFWKCPVCLKPWKTIDRRLERKVTYFPCLHQMELKRGTQIWKPVEKKGEQK